MLKNRRVITVIIIIITTIIVSILAMSIMKYYSTPIITENIFNKNRIDSSIIKDNKIKEILNKCYYSNQKYAGFSSIPLSENTPDLYQVSWLLNIMKISNSDEKLFNSIRDNIYPLLKNDDILNEIQNAQLFTSIRNNLGIKDYDKNSIVQMIQKHYDENEMLFFSKDINESIQNKLVATNVILNILNNMNIRIKEIDFVKNKLIKLYNNDTYFYKNNVQEAITLNGGSIISSLYSLGLTYKNLGENKSARKEWLDFCNNSILSQNSTDIFSTFIISNIVEINNFFDNDFNLSPDYISKYGKEHNSIMTFNMSEDGFNADPQFLYVALKLYKMNKLSLNLKSDIDKYISDTINYGFEKNKGISLTTSDNYYGIVLSNVFGIAYDKGKVNNLLINWYNTMMDSGFVVKDQQQLTETYYLLFSLNEQNIHFKGKEEIIKGIENYLEKVNYNDENQRQANLTIINIALQISSIIKLNISDNLMKRINDYFLLNINNSLNNIVNIDNVYRINKYINHNKTGDVISSQINISLSKLYINGGYKFNPSLDDDTTDIISTVRGLDILQSTHDISSTQKKEIQDFLKSLHSDTLFKINSLKNESTLRVIYNGCKLSTYYWVGK